MWYIFSRFDLLDYVSWNNEIKDVAGVASNEGLILSYRERHTLRVWIAKTHCNHIECDSSGR